MTTDLRRSTVDPSLTVEFAGRRGAEVLPGLPGPWAMRTVVQNYDWGIPGAMTKLQGRTPSDRPEAELWIGAHPGGASELVLPGGESASLLGAIDRFGPELLGAGLVQRFGCRLPFLLKVLAVGRALSIQVHPTADQAAAGHAGDETSGASAGERRFVDPYAKPEMLVPLGPFVALVGLRPAGEASRLIRSLGVAALDPVLGMLDRNGTAEALALLATWPEADRAALARVLHARFRGDTRIALEPGSPLDGVREEQLVRGWIRKLLDEHPGDPLAIAPCLLRIHHLVQDQAVYIPPGVPHAYLSGSGVEIMGASDNVVRAGLTRKRVDGVTLAAILDPSAEPLFDVPRMGIGPCESMWEPQTPEFALSRIDVHGRVDLVRDGTAVVGPEIVLCTDGYTDVIVPGSTPETIGSGCAAFVGATAGIVSLRGEGEVFRARIAG